MPITLFLADDHAVMREGLARLLAEHQDLRVLGAAANGRDAVREIAHLHPQVAILDIAMPEMNGIEATRQLADRSPETRVVILSMYLTPEHVFHAIEAGARGYILKEQATEEIVNAIRTVHAGKRYVGAKVAAILAEHLTRRPDAEKLEGLSRREREILQLVAEGSSSARIAARLNLAPGTVDTYRSRLMNKLQINDVAGLVKFAIQQGLITLE